MAYTFADRVKTLRAEFDERHPKARMTLIAYLADAGYTPDKEPSIEHYTENIKYLMDYIYQDTDEFFAMMEELDDEEVETQDKEPSGITPLDTARDRGSYL